MDIRLVKDMLNQDQLDLAVTVQFDGQQWNNVNRLTILSEPQKIIVSDKHPWARLEKITEEDILEQDLLVYDGSMEESEDYFMPGLEVRKRIPIRNYDIYMGVLEQGECFGVISKVYGMRDGSFRLIDLPEKRRSMVHFICAFKPLHPLANELEKLNEMKIVI